MNKTQGLGKGLSSLIPQKIDREIISEESEVFPADERIVKVPLNKIKANPHQSRTIFDHDGLEELTNSIKEHGILQPIILTKNNKGEYEVIAGERRLRASELLGLETIPSIIRDIKDQQKLEIGLVENIQRRDLNQIEEAVAYQRLIDEFSLTQEEVSRKVGKSRSAVTNTLRLLSLPSEIQKALINGKINYSTARVIAGLPVEDRLKFFKKVMSQDLTVRAVEGHASAISTNKRHKKSKDPVLTSLEEQVQSALGTKVTIKKSGETGTIMIEFYSNEELQNLINKFSETSSD